MKKSFSKIYNIGFLLISLVLFSCSSVPEASKIVPMDFAGISQVKTGELAQLKWEFENAVNVHIIEKNRNYKGYDSTEFRIDSSCVFNFLITNQIDTLEIPWRIYAYDDESGKVETGLKNSNTKKVSYMDSKYLRGTMPFSDGTAFKYLKIMRYAYPYENTNSLRAKVLVLDEYGNYVSGYGEDNADLVTVSSQISCSDNFENSIVTGFKENRGVGNEGIDLAILLDNSSIAGDFFPIYDQIRNFTGSLDANDRFGLYSFNQDFKENISLRNTSLVAEMLTKPNKAVGLSAIYKSLKKCIDTIANNNSSRQKVIVLIAYSSDNASIIYDRNEIISLAKSKDIPIYVIGVGNAIDSYSLNSLASSSGAVFYEIDDSLLVDLPYIFNEIYFAQKNNYQFDINIPYSLVNGCSKLNTKISFVNAYSNCENMLSVPLVAERHEFNYMAVASFGYSDTLITGDYLETVYDLAEILKKNPNLPVELIGNSSIEGNDKICYDLGLKRAQSIRKLLINRGVNSSQIRVRSDGSNNPIYYLQDSPWKQYYNRRLEIRWLDPELLPFEIITQLYETESEALEEVEKWESRGYRAYFERYLQSNIPIYRVKLWGYAKQDDAEKTSKKLNKDYGLKSFVQ